MQWVLTNVFIVTKISSEAQRWELDSNTALPPNLCCFPFRFFWSFVIFCSLLSSPLRQRKRNSSSRFREQLTTGQTLAWVTFSIPRWACNKTAESVVLVQAGLTDFGKRMQVISILPLCWDWTTFPTSPVQKTTYLTFCNILLRFGTTMELSWEWPVWIFQWMTYRTCCEAGR